MAVTLDADDLQGQGFAFLDHLLGMSHTPIHQFRYVDQALQGAFDSGEGAKGRELGHLAGDDLPHLILVDKSFPLLGLGPPQAKGDLLVLLVHLQDVDIYFLTHLEHLIGRFASVPGEL